MKKPAFGFGWVPVKGRNTVKPGGHFSMREWQEDCFTKLSSSRHFIINAPTAAGKSFAISAMIADRLRTNPSLRAIISVPQTIIASGFRDNRIEFPDGSRIHFVPQYDLSQRTPDSNLSQIDGFLAGPNDVSSVNDRVLICSHASLVMAFKSNPTAFRDVLLILDEAHHAQNAEMQDMADITISNELGAVIMHSLRETRLNIQVGLSTATFFRGDRLSIIPKGHETDFDRFDLAYDEYLKSCEHLCGFQYDFVLYHGEYPSSMRELFSSGVGKSIVYIPPVNGRYTIGEKNDDVDAVLRAISQNDHPEIRDADQPVMRVRRGRGWINVVNLVDEDLRDEKKAAIVADHGAEKSGIDVIITLNMFKEGASWRWAERSVIVGVKRSLNEVIQIIGRLFRDCPGKETVTVHHLIPAGVDTMDEDETRRNLNDYMKAIFLSMILEDILRPIFIRTPRPKREQEDDGDEPVEGGRFDPIREVFTSETEIAGFHEEVRDRVLELVDADPSLRSDTVRLMERFTEIVSEVLSEDGIEEFHEEVAQQVWAQWTRRTQAMSGVDVADVDFDILGEGPLGFLLAYTSGVCGCETFRELRQALIASKYYKIPFEEARDYARSLGLKNQGQWFGHCRTNRLPDGIAADPQGTYAGEGWAGWGDWLGTGNLGARNFRSFEDARDFVRNLNLRNGKEWISYSQSDERPVDIPSDPARVYASDGWAGMKDWLGTGRRISWRVFEEARSFVHTLGLTGKTEWNEYSQSAGRPEDIPANPASAYSNAGWVSWGDWLGTGVVATYNRQYRPFDDAREFARSLGLKDKMAWGEYAKSGDKPDDIPANPPAVYADSGWAGWGDWTGTGNVGPKDHTYRLFEDSREFARSLGLKSGAEWSAYWKEHQIPRDIPLTPRHIYADQGWAGMKDFLGTAKS